MKTVSRYNDLQKAVIEAAKAAKADLRGYMRRHYELFGTSNPHFEHPFDVLLEAVEALEATEPDVKK